MAYALGIAPNATLPSGGELMSVQSPHFPVGVNWWQFNHHQRNAAEPLKKQTTSILPAHRLRRWPDRATHASWSRSRHGPRSLAAAGFRRTPSLSYATPKRGSYTKLTHTLAEILALLLATSTPHHIETPNRSATPVMNYRPRVGATRTIFCSRRTGHGLCRRAIEDGGPRELATFRSKLRRRVLSKDLPASWSLRDPVATLS